MIEFLFIWIDKLSDHASQGVILPEHGPFTAVWTVHIDVLDKSKSEIEAHCRGTACTEKRKRNTPNGQQCEAHADVEKRL